MKVLVIGAGISGLGTARALSSDGHEITVFEKRKALRTAGAALTLWSNGSGIPGRAGRIAGWGRRPHRLPAAARFRPQGI
jgi:2-polyprenyl-6-methoxyphenol hydroxylase-like FAD-dependent oxidoreductase